MTTKKHIGRYFARILHAELHAKTDSAAHRQEGAL
jgi:hypothetical protein